MAGEWRETTIGEFAPFAYGKGLSERVRDPSGDVPVFGSNGIVGYHSEALTCGPTVVIGRKGTVGAVHFSQNACWPIDTTFFVVDDDPLILRFKYYLLKSLDLEHMNADSAVPGLNRDAAHALRILVPPLSEQRAIAHILGTLDDKIELNRRMSETLEAMARALFKAWFVDFEPVRAKCRGAPGGRPRWRRGLPGTGGFHTRPYDDLFPDRLVDSELGQIPEGWRIGTLGTLSEKPQYGYTASAREEPIGPKFLRITDINKLAWIDWSTVPYCEIEQQDFEQYRLYPGDVLIARMADPGHGVVIEEQVEAVFASYLIRFRLKDQVYIRYIQYWLRSDGYWELVTSRHAGTTRASLNAQVLSSFQLIIPPKPIASAFSEIVNALRNKVVAAVNESRTLAALRDALLPKLIRGEIRVKDAERFLKEREL